MEQIKILCVIPARGGSKRIYKKNMKLLDNKPLLSYTITAAKESKYITKTVISTEDKEIKDFAMAFSVEVIDRPKELAQDDTPTLPIIKHAVLEIERKGFFPELIVILQPTSPLRDAQDVDRAIEYIIKSDADSVVGVCKSKYLVLKEKDNSLTPLFDNQEPNYYLNGAIYIIKRDRVFIEDKYVFGGKILPFVMGKEKSIDIDTPLDFQIAEFLMKQTNKEEWVKPPYD